jgi:hypothetical protein
MTSSQGILRGIAVLAAIAWAGLLIGCGKSTPLIRLRPDGALPGGGGTGSNDASFGTGGTGGGTGGNMEADARSDTGGGNGTGGVTVIGTGGAIGGRGGSGLVTTGGRLGTGGVIVDGGAPGSGGRTRTGGTTGAGGITGTGGSTQIACGGPTGITCPQGQFCDAASSCGKNPEVTGVCVPMNARSAWPPTAAPVCGCENMTYSNDCLRKAAGMLKAADGVCPNAPPSYPTAYLVWEVPASPSETGPAVVVNAAAGRMDAWSGTAGFSPETPPSNPTTTQTLALDQTDSLWVRLAGVNLTNIPHGTPGSTGCNATLYFRHCQGCAAFTLRYSEPEQVTPELTPLWSWFDSMMGDTAATNPRSYCK